MIVFSANTEIDRVKRSNEGEIAKLSLALKKMEIQVQSMEQTVEQKVFFKLIVINCYYEYTEHCGVIIKLRNIVFFRKCGPRPKKRKR